MSLLPENEVYVIAEMANAHEGRLDAALQICEAAARSGAHAIKVQVFTADEVAVPSHPNYGLYKSLEMSAGQWGEFIALARKRSLGVFCDVEGFASADMMMSVGVDGFKIHASDTQNRPLIQKLAQYGKPVFLSTGGSTWIEIAETIEFLKTNGAAEVLLMHGIQNYPTRLVDSHLRRLHFLREHFQLPLGYAPHADGATKWAVELPLLAVAAGAQALEIHITLDRSAKGLDYYSSLEPDEFAQLTQRIKEIAPTLGSQDPALAPNEIDYRYKHKKQVVAIKDIAAGDTLTYENLGMKRVESAPHTALMDINAVIGKKAARAISLDSAILPKDIKMTVAAVLACRLHSTRLYGKPMQLIGGEPIMSHLIRQLRQVKSLDHIVLAITDGPDQGVLIDYAKQNGLLYVVGSEQNVLHRLILGADKVNADIVLRNTTENPYSYWENVDEMIRLHIENGADMTVTEKLPWGSQIQVISTSALKKSHKYGEDRHRSEGCDVYMIEHPEIFKIQRLLPPEKLARPDLRLTVDNPEDLMLVRTIWENLPKQNNLIPLEAVVDYLNANPQVVAINSKYASPSSGK